MTDNVKEIDLKNGERFTIAWDIVRLQQRMGVNAATATWSIASGTSVQMVSTNFSNTLVKAMIDCVEDGCSVVKTIVTMQDGQRVSHEYIVNVSTVTC